MKQKELLEVIEYDRISILSPEFKDSKEFPMLPEKTFKELESFVKDYSEESDTDGLDFFQLGYDRVRGDTISVKNYVGLIELKSGFQVQILPKLDLGNEEVSTKDIFWKMLRSLKDFPAKVSDFASIKEDRMNLYEAFIEMYLKDVQNLVKHGLRSAYEGVEENSQFLKGKLMLSNHIKENLAHNERFYVRYDEYKTNRAENKLIKTTLQKLSLITGSEKNLVQIKQLLSYFENIEVSTNYEKDFSKVVIDRNMKDYDRLMAWSKVFLFNKSFLTFTGDTQARALLFPMEKLFEEYVAKELKKVLPEDWSLSAQDSGFYLFDNPKIFKLRPDIVLRKNDGRVVVMDTKWKRLVPNQRKNYGISQSDMYQMYAYSKKYETKDIWLLYPKTEEMKQLKTKNGELSFKSDDSLPTTVHLFFVELDSIENSMRDLFIEVMSNEGVDITVESEVF